MLDFDILASFDLRAERTTDFFGISRKLQVPSFTTSGINSFGRRRVAL